MEQPRSTTPGQQASNSRASISGNQQSNSSAVTARQSSSFTVSTPTVSHPSPAQPPEISGEPCGTVQVKPEPVKSQGCIQLDDVGNSSNSSGPRKRRAEHVAAHHVKRHAPISKAGDDVIDLTGELDDPAASRLQNSTLRSADDAVHLLANAETGEVLCVAVVNIAYPQGVTSGDSCLVLLHFLLQVRVYIHE